MVLHKMPEKRTTSRMSSHVISHLFRGFWMTMAISFLPSSAPIHSEQLSGGAVEFLWQLDYDHAALAAEVQIAPQRHPGPNGMIASNKEGSVNLRSLRLHFLVCDKGLKI